MPRRSFRETSHRKSVNRRSRASFESLELRLLLAADPAGDKSGVIVNDTEWNDTNAPYVVVGTLEIADTAILTIGPGVNVLIREDQTITVHGALNIHGADAVQVEDGRWGNSSGILVYGNMTVTDTSFTRIGNNDDSSRVAAMPGGRLQATNTSFAWDYVSWEYGSVLDVGDMSGNRFETPVWSTVQQVAALVDSQRLGEVNLRPGEMLAGETAELNLIGGDGVANTRYVVTGELTIQEGATLTVGQDVQMLIREDQTITVHGALNIHGADAVQVEDGRWGNSSGILVYGNMTVTDTSFTRIGNNDDSSRVAAMPGGRLRATNTSFAWDYVSWEYGSVLDVGDMSGNRFETPVWSTVQQVAALVDSQRLGEVNLRPGEMLAGETAELNLIGGDGVANTRYVVTGELTIQEGATLTVGQDVQMLIREDQTITVHGALNIHGADAVQVEDGRWGNSSGILVYGNMTVTDTSFTRIGNNDDSSRVAAMPGGRLRATNTSFAWDYVSWEYGSVLDVGDMSGNRFETPVWSTVQQVAALVDSQRLGEVNLRPGEMLAGETAELNLIGGDGVANTRYVVTGELTIQEGATLTVGQDVQMLIREDQTITVHGALNIHGADAVQVEDGRWGNSSGILVYGNMTVTDTSFTRIGNNDDQAGVVVQTGAELQAHNLSFAWDTLSLDTASTLVMHLSEVAASVSIDSGALLEVTQNDLTSATVTARGEVDRTIDLNHNWWGTLDPTAIDAKITHQTDNASLPLVAYDPFLLLPPTAPDLVASSVTVATGVPLIGQFLTLEYVIENGNSGIVADPSAALFYLNRNSSLDGAALLPTVAVDSIGPGATTGTQSITVRLPNSDHPVWDHGLPATYQISMYVDCLAGRRMGRKQQCGFGRHPCRTSSDDCRTTCVLQRFVF